MTGRQRLRKREGQTRRRRKASRLAKYWRPSDVSLPETQRVGLGHARRTDHAHKREDRDRYVEE